MGQIVSISGHSGIGKTTLTERLLKELPGASIVTSLTTRPWRESDLPGEYRYLEGDEKKIFDESAADFLWDIRRGSTRYGTLKSAVDDALASTDGIGIMILTPDVVPTLQRYITERIGNASSLMPLYMESPPDESELSYRLYKRGVTEREILERSAMEDTWDEIARRSAVPFRFIKSSSRENTFAEAAVYILGRLFH